MKIKGKTKREELLDLAKKTVVSERQDNYGEPEDSFEKIAAFWTTYLGHSVTKSDVPAMMSLLKIARLSTTPNHKDSWVDMAGYAACGYEVSQEIPESKNTEPAKRKVATLPPMPPMPPMPYGDQT